MAIHDPTTSRTPPEGAPTVFMPAAEVGLHNVIDQLDDIRDLQSALELAIDGTEFMNPPDKAALRLLCTTCRDQIEIAERDLEMVHSAMASA